MSQHPSSPPRPPADRSHWTPEKQRGFLIALMESGNVASAARAVGMTRSSAHRLRQRLAGTPFDRSWTSALALYAARMADPFAPRPVASRG
jgi:hypothetical protein